MDQNYSRLSSAQNSAQNTPNQQRKNLNSLENILRPTRNNLRVKSQNTFNDLIELTESVSSAQFSEGFQHSIKQFVKSDQSLEGAESNVNKIQAKLVQISRSFSELTIQLNKTQRLSQNLKLEDMI